MTVDGGCPDGQDHPDTDPVLAQIAELDSSAATLVHATLIVIGGG